MKNCYIISYDISDGGEYEELYKAIKEYGSWAHITESTWAITTSNGHKEIRDNLGKHLPDGSRLIVVKSGGAGAWRNVICRNEWLKGNL